MAETPRRSFRIGDPIYLKARKVADSHGEDLTTVVIRALDDYSAKGVKRSHKKKEPAS